MEEKIRDYKGLRLLRLRLAMTAIYFLAMTTCFFSTAYANNIQVTNCQLLNMVPTSTTGDIQFDISWDNSWRYGSLFYDAAWVFAKVSVNGAPWQHATITGVTSAGASGTGLTIDVPPDHKGVFLYRSAAGTGTLNTTAVTLQWDRQGDGVVYSVSKVRIQVFAIEMVHIPQGSFYAGDGSACTGGTNSHFFDASSSSGAAVKITSTAPYLSNVSNGSGTPGDIAWASESLYDGNLPDARMQLNANFPTGYNSFYIMKYGITQGQYRDFLNTLTRDQQVNRVGTDITSGITSVTKVYVLSNSSTVYFRNGVACAGTIPATDPVTFFCDLNGNGIPNESTDGEWIACNYISWTDLCAYADWAALRPMTELELEKAARGPKPAVAGEYAWGTTNITEATGISNAGTNNEIASNSAANCVSGNTAVQGPLRSGFAATATSTTRESAGASYYGVMELSGNLWSRVVSVGNANGVLFNGTHGDGVLSALGYADGVALQYWPGYSNSHEITGITGSGFRGGIWLADDTYARVSDRSYAAYPHPARENNYGGRLVRTQ